MRFPALFALLFALPVVAQEAWLTDFEAAKAAAKKDQKVILADFTGSDWCGWCKKLHAEVFDKPEFDAWAKKNVVLLELDFPRSIEQSEDLKKQNQALAKQFNIRGYPTILLLDADGKKLGQLGYQPGGPAAWIQSAEAQWKGGGGGAAGQEIVDQASAAGWLVNYKDALAKAGKEGKALLVDFTGSDWCSSCQRLRDEVFQKPEFVAWAEAHVVRVEIDFPKKRKQSPELKKQNQGLAEQFGVQGYPTVLLLDPKGKKLGELGYVEGGPAAWLAKAEAILTGKPAK